MANVNKIENRITFLKKAEYHLELLTPEIMKFLRSSKKRQTKNKIGNSVPQLDIT